MCTRLNYLRKLRNQLFKYPEKTSTEDQCVCVSVWEELQGFKYFTIQVFAFINILNEWRVSCCLTVMFMLIYIGSCTSPPLGMHLAPEICIAPNYTVFWWLHYTVLNCTKMHQSALSPIRTLSICVCQTLAIINSGRLD